jgi:hypothetical protein
MTRTYDENAAAGMRMNCACFFCKTYQLKEQTKMATSDFDPTPKMNIEWDKYGHLNLKNNYLGGFDKPNSLRPTMAFFYDETREIDPDTGGEKGKKLAELGAIDPQSLMELAKVAGYGSEKYTRLNYMKGYKWSLSYDALQRHLMAFWSGESIDPESGLHHLAHAAWHCMTLLSYSARGLGTDDRYEGLDWDTSW